MQERIHAFFSGRVQGVGFRFSTKSLALRFNLSGWVKNLDDGRVEMMIQADSQSLGDFLKAIRREFEGYIANDDIEWLEADDNQ